MPNFDIVRQANPKKTFRVASVMGTYDLQSNSVQEHFVGDIALPDEWSVGLIVGNSGTGKTTIAKELFPDAYITQFEYTHESILDDMPQGRSVDDIVKTLSSVGFASPPSWLKPYAVLSNGEKMRCDLARAILSDKDLFVFDEFTSVVDRTVVLPDFQGAGIGTAFSDAIAQMYTDVGYTYISTTSNPAFIHARAKSPKWMTTRPLTRCNGGTMKPGIQKSALGKSSGNRLTVGFKYIQA